MIRFAASRLAAVRFVTGSAVLALTVVCALAAAPAQENAAQAGAHAPALPPELAKLQAWTGTWDAEVSLMGQTSTGTEVCRMDVGGYWLATEFTGTFLGAPFHGRGYTGWDAAKSRYSGVWVDSSGGPMSVFATGTFSKDGKTFTALVDGVGPDGKPMKCEHVTTFPDAKTRVFEIHDVGGAKRELQMRITYTKRA